jgi:hypothetical protein
MSAHPSCIWFPLNDLSKSLEKFIHKVGDHKSKAKCRLPLFPFWNYALFTLAGREEEDTSILILIRLNYYII